MSYDYSGKRYINEFNIPTVFSGTIMISSHMGTGKSSWLHQVVRDNTSVVYVSCRRSFTSKITDEFNLDSYRHHTGLLDALNHPKIAVQIEALQRTNIASYNVVVLDEFCSLVDHSSQDHEKMYLLTNALSCAKRLVVCDALLNQNWIDSLSYMLKGYIAIIEGID